MQVQSAFFLDLGLIGSKKALDLQQDETYYASRKGYETRHLRIMDLRIQIGSPANARHKYD